MGWLAGAGSAAGEDPADGPGGPDPTGGDPGCPDAPAGALRDERLVGFAPGGRWDQCPPGPDLATALAAIAGPDGRCPGASDQELAGALRRAAAQESHAAAVKLALARELIRRDPVPPPGRTFHGDLPDQWSDSVTYELALALACSVTSAQNTALMAWELGARLPGIEEALADGTLTCAEARLVTEVCALLSDADAARAEALLLPLLPGKTYAQIASLANRIAVQVDPTLAERRRKGAVKHASRVQMFREQSGAAALSGRDLPPDEVLAANANVNARAALYKASGTFKGARMDQLRAVGYLDILNGRDAATRIALGYLSTDPEPGDDGPLGDSPNYGSPDDARNDVPDDGFPDDVPDDDIPDVDVPDEAPGNGPPADAAPGEDHPDGGEHGGTPPTGGNWPLPDGPGNSSGTSSGPQPSDEQPPDALGFGCAGSGRAGPGVGSGPTNGGPPGGPEPPGEGSPGSRSAEAAVERPALTDLVIPLATLLGLAERPGEAHGLGVLDPALCRDLAALAAASPHTRLCLTVTDSTGVTIGHGCARPGKPGGKPTGKRDGAPLCLPRIGTSPPGVSLPARANLTITADHLIALLRAVPGTHGAAEAPGARTAPGARAGSSLPSGSDRRAGGWGLRRTERAGPGGTENLLSEPQWPGAWTLTLPDGRELALRIEPVASQHCDHRHESFAYQPNATLRHHVQIRDYVCSFPTCNRHARESDFEHCVPYDQGGRTCSCNASARSRKCHRVKQAKGWTVTQPKPAWHAWTTPSGWTYVRQPYQYPV